MFAKQININKFFFPRVELEIFMNSLIDLKPYSHLIVEMIEEDFLLKINMWVTTYVRREGEP